MSIVQQRSGLVVCPMQLAIALPCRITVVLSSSSRDITALGLRRIHGVPMSTVLALDTLMSVALEISV
jgi:hypothetical protein